MSENNTLREWTRRQAVKTGAAVGAGAAFALNLGRFRKARAASGTNEIRIGLVGAGGRGKGAVRDAMKASPNTRLVAVGDLFKDAMDGGMARLAQSEDAERMKVPADKTYVGWDATEKVLANDLDYVILATPPGFRPMQFEAAIKAGKNVFMEKPMAVDGPGIRKIMEMGKVASEKKLAVGVGLQRRHHEGYHEMMKQIKKGAIGKIVAARCYWNQGSLWMKPREKGWTDMEWQLRNWLYFSWLSGDHIVEQHIHNIDVVNWAIGSHPVAAVAMGGRQQRVEKEFGHIYDHHAVDFEYPDDVHVLSMCRQIPRCANAVSEHIVGSHGTANADNKDFEITGKRKWKWNKEVLPYVQEHADLIKAIQTGKPYNETQQAAESNLSAIMGRMSSYSGKRVTWDEALNSTVDLSPPKYAFGKLDTPPIAIPGVDQVI